MMLGASQTCRSLVAKRTVAQYGTIVAERSDASEAYVHIATRCSCVRNRVRGRREMCGK